MQANRFALNRINKRVFFTEEINLGNVRTGCRSIKFRTSFADSWQHIQRNNRASWRPLPHTNFWCVLSRWPRTRPTRGMPLLSQKNGEHPWKVGANTTWESRRVHETSLLNAQRVSRANPNMGYAHIRKITSGTIEISVNRVVYTPAADLSILIRATVLSPATRLLGSPQYWFFNT